MFSLIESKIHMPSSYTRGARADALNFAKVQSLLMENSAVSHSVTPQRRADPRLMPITNQQQFSRANRSKSPQRFMNFSQLDQSYNEIRQKRLNQNKSMYSSDIPDHLLWENERKIRQLMDFRNKPHHDRACKDNTQLKPALDTGPTNSPRTRRPINNNNSNEIIAETLYRPIPKVAIKKNTKPVRLEEIRKKSPEPIETPTNAKPSYQVPLRNMQVKETLRYLLKSSKTPHQSGLIGEASEVESGFPDLNLREVKVYRLRDRLVNQIKPEFNKFKPIGVSEMEISHYENEANNTRGGFKRREPSAGLYSKLSLENIKTKKNTITLVSSVYEGRSCTLYIPYPAECHKKNDTERCQRYQLLSEEMIPSFLCENGARSVLKILENAKLIEEQNPRFSIIWGRVPDIHFLNRMLGWQKVNHFPGSLQVGKKSNLWKNYNRLRQMFPHDYNYIPQTYLLDSDLHIFQTRQQTAKNEALWIMKPSTMSGGNGIQIVQKNFKLAGGAPKKGVLVSDYISNPHLINNLKYDLRIYVLVSSMDPLKIYLHEEGIVKFATKEYSNDIESINDKFIHLTNYSVNKESPDYKPNVNINEEAFAHKWSLRKLRKAYEQLGISYEKLMKEIKDMVIKTFISAEPHVFEGSGRSYNVQKKCFELFGLDILIDSELKPWLIEVNTFPSFNTDSPIDSMVKSTVLCDTLNLVGLRMESLEKSSKSRGEEDLQKVKKRNIAALETLNEKNCIHILNTEDWEMLFDSEEELYRRGGFELLFPLTENIENYKKFFEIERYNNVLLWKYKELGHEEDLLEQVTSLQFAKDHNLNQI